MTNTAFVMGSIYFLLAAQYAQAKQVAITAVYLSLIHIYIALADRTDLVMVAPATANVCAKLAHGLADDMLTTTVLACTCPKLIAPAMNTKMFENQVTQDNLDTLRHYGREQ